MAMQFSKTIKVMPYKSEPVERQEQRMVTGAITEPCLAGKHDECRLLPNAYYTRCGCQAIGCHVERDCEFDHIKSVEDCDGIAQIELINAVAVMHEKPLRIWICQWCFDHYCTVFDSGNISISVLIDHGRYNNNLWVISDRADRSKL